MPEKSLAAEASKNTSRAKYGTVEFDGVEYAIERKPPMLLLAELSGIELGEEAALTALSEVFKVTLGEGYRDFRKAMLYSEAGQDENVLGELLGKIIERTTGRPTD